MDRIGTEMFDWTVTGAGWAHATLRLGDGTEPLEIIASYLHDSLRDLAGALLSIDEGAREAQFLLMDEPGEHLVILRRASERDLEVEVRWFADWASWKMHPLDGYETIGRGVVRWRTFRGAAVSSMQRLLSELGEDGYRQMWVQHDFPTRELRMLERKR